RAARARVHVVLRLQTLAHRELLFLAAGREGHAGDLLARPQVAFRVAVAVEAPPHRERRPLLHLRHLIDAAVAGDAAHALLHVDGMVEVGEVRELVDLVPDDGAIGEEALPDRRELGALVPDLRVAVEAQRGRRNPREVRFLHRRVAVAAVDPFVTDVVPVIELDRLIDRILLLRVQRTADVDHRPRDDSAREEQEKPEQREAERGVRRRLEEGAHSVSGFDDSIAFEGGGATMVALLDEATGWFAAGVWRAVASLCRIRARGRSDSFTRARELAR